MNETTTEFDMAVQRQPWESPCGTNAAFGEHLKRGEDPCDECVDAHRQYVNWSARSRRAAKHGTRNGYASHAKAGEPPCPDCRAWHEASLSAKRAVIDPRSCGTLKNLRIHRRRGESCAVCARADRQRQEQSRARKASFAQRKSKVPHDWNGAIHAFGQSYVQAGKSPGTAETRTGHMRRFAQTVGKPIADVKRMDVLHFMSYEGWNAATFRSVRASITMFFRFTQKNGLRKDNPCIDLPNKPAPPHNPKPVPEDCYRQVVADCPSELRIAVRLAGELGLRRAEVAAVEAGHIEEDNDGIVLRVFGKGRKTRYIPISEDFATAIRDHIATHGDGTLAFPSPYGGTVSPHWMGSLISRLLPDGYTMHKLRHRAATQVHRRSGGDLLLASELLGHSSVSTTQIYVAPDRSKLRKLVGELSI